MIDRIAERAYAARTIGLVGLMASLAWLAGGCEGARLEYSTPRAEELKGSAHPARLEAVEEPSPARAGHGLPPGHPPVSGTSASREAPAWRPGEPFDVLGLTFVPPQGWVREPPANSLRLAQFRLPRVESDAYDGELVFSTAFGGLEENISRWRGQFADLPEPAVSRRQAGGIEVTLVDMEGSFLYDGTPRPGYRVAIAVVQAPRGQLFIKGYGPKATMEEWQDEFLEMVDGLVPSR